MEKVIEIIKQIIEALGKYRLELNQVFFWVPILTAILAVVIIPLLARVIKSAKRLENLRKKFKDEYQIVLPDMLQVQERSDDRADNYIVIGYSNTKDVNAVYVGKYILKTDKVGIIPSVVRSLRKNRVKIAPHQIEIDKYKYLMRQREQRNKYANLRSIVGDFSNQPAKFEAYCAEVLRNNGFKTFLTPPVNDGGYDIKAYKDGQSYIVECKCYAPGNTVGRPLLQKLYGANGSVRADKMIYITTSEFTKTAVKYANEMNIFLIDGIHLMELSNAKTTPQTISEEEWGMTVDDVQCYVR